MYVKRAVRARYWCPHCRAHSAWFTVPEDLANGELVRRQRDHVAERHAGVQPCGGTAPGAAA